MEKDHKVSVQTAAVQPTRTKSTAIEPRVGCN